MSIEYGILVKTKTRLESLIERFNTAAQAKFYLERMGGDFEAYEEEDAIYKESLLKVQRIFSRILKNKIIERAFLPSYIFTKKNLILVLGPDGLLANTAKYAQGVPIIGINPDPERNDGVLLPFQADNFGEAVVKTIKGQARIENRSFAEAKLNDGQRLLAFNDLFIGAASHVSARYRINFEERSENHSSSGLIVSTRTGSTGWLSSIFNMAYGIVKTFDQEISQSQPQMAENELLFAVREPFKSLRSQTDICMGFINAQKSLQLESHMPSGGLIFSDGIEEDFLHFNSGSIASIGLAKEKARLVQA
ncbi:MAG: sugar kinase [Bacteroidia bacterium]|nr:sugar kinase [Bacteroidia bacterium]